MFKTTGLEVHGLDSSHTHEALRKLGMDDPNKIQTPVDSSTKLVKGRDEYACVDQQLYQSAVGCLLYLSIATRSDIAYAVSNVAKFFFKTNKTSLGS